MCGIAGILEFGNRSPSLAQLKKMTDIIAHRGPDGEGQWSEENIALGHRRLSIIDLSETGHQPMVSFEGRYVITYNGEIYNYKELRQELISLGYQFFSTSDTEVLINAFHAWREKSLEKLNGMFAFAIWDRKEKELWLARDRYGIKPVYYASCDGRFLFGSEIKSIMAHDSAEAELDREALLEYFTFQNFLTEKTLHKNVSILPAGSYLRINSTQTCFEPNYYWDYDFQSIDESTSETELTEELAYLIEQAVSRQLVADVEVSSYLSGGMDSGSIASIAAKKLPFINTFTVGFDMSSASGLELSYDERDKAEQMSYLFKTEHYEMVLKAGDMERCMSKLVWHLEEPRVGQSYPNFYAAKLASKFGKVVLSGAGGDELFAGYPWRYYRAVRNDDFEHYIDKYYGFWKRLIDNTNLQKIFAPIKSDVENVWTRNIMRDVFKHHDEKFSKPEDYVHHSLYFESKTFLHGLFVVEDKLSMAHSLETRVPFMDNDLVDFAMKVPARYKLKDLENVVRIDENDMKKFSLKTNDGKQIFRKAMARHLPAAVTDRVKQGFSSPDASWFRGESIEYVREKLLNNNAKIYDYLDKQTVQSLILEHLDGRQNRRLFIWSLLNFEEWCHQFLHISKP